MAPLASRREAVRCAVRFWAPRISNFDLEAVVDHVLDSETLSGNPLPSAAWLAMVAYIRHTCTDYDDLLQDGYDVDSARHFVADAMNKVLINWGANRKANVGSD